MAIYLGTNKLTGTGVQVDDALNSTSNNPVANSAVTNALTEVGYSEWQKPADWVDIRSCALSNSVYFLVGHSADYSTYPTFAFKVTTIGGGTYDVFVDGIKVATTASASDTTLNWQTLALSSGYDVTYPSALHTHVIRVTSSTAGDAIKTPKVTTGGGCLWIHLQDVTYTDGLDNSFKALGILEAITSNKGEFTFAGNMVAAFQNCYALVEIPKLIAASTNNKNGTSAFVNCNKLRKLKLKNIHTSGNIATTAMNSLSSIETEDCSLGALSSLTDAYQLETIPVEGLSSTVTSLVVSNCANLKNTLLDLQPYSSMTRVAVYGDSDHNVAGLKGLVVSNAAPLTGTSPQINVSYTGLDRAALVTLFNSLPTVTGSQVCNVTGATGASDLTAEDIAIAVNKGWTLTR